MIRDKDLQQLLAKSEELKALFVLGQRVVPFLEELFVFVREVSPALEDINKSIEDNLSRIPKASKQLSKVTEATELATNEIMDI
ncbi:MAG: chemotaxis protein CheZ, partial [Candidatus Kapabacteria bacterium]|nr:chemotaxis protein CheZ [Candidatus Kapabacteria bacterium]